MTKPAIYRIRLQGMLDDESWQYYLGTGWTVEVDDSTAETTTITGATRDQAALIGLLTNLYDVGLPLLEVEYLETSGRKP